MKKLIQCITIAVISQTTGLTQGCLPEGITFTSQSQIDSFQVNYPGCTEIEGDVGITGNNITSLSGLNEVTIIDGYLLFHFNSALTNMSGLDNLSLIGGDVDIYNNDALTSLYGLESLTSIGGILEINNNDALVDLSGLENLQSIDGHLFIWCNDALANISGLQSLTSVENYLTISSNGSLTSLSGLQNLVSIGDNLNIGDNASLTSLSGLEGLTSIAGSLNLWYNSSLTSLSGIDNINAGSVSNLNISSNPSLSTCAIQCICNYLAAPNGTIEIHDNAPGCNSPEEVEEACEVLISCLPEGIIFSTQEQIDNFQTNYPGCTDIEGSVTIEGNFNITNLNGLNVIEKISGDLTIVHNYNLQNLQGLNSLTEIQGGLEIAFNVGLLNFEGFESLSVIGNNIYIVENTGLESCLGFENLVAIPGILGIGENPALMDLSGFNNLAEVGFLLIIESNPALQSLQGLNNLDHIGEDLILENNDELSDITALSDLTSIGDYLHIKGNNSLSILTGIENIQENSINNLTIIENSLLQDCDVNSICEYLISPNGTIEIHDNAPGCNSPDEVLLACETAIDENKTQALSISPNPASSFITITTPQGEPALEAVIYNHLGQKVLTTKPVNNRLDVSGLKAGMYLMEIKMKEKTERAKFVKN